MVPAIFRLHSLTPCHSGHMCLHALTQTFTPQQLFLQRSLVSREPRTNTVKFTSFTQMSFSNTAWGGAGDTLRVTKKSTKINRGRNQLSSESPSAAFCLFVVSFVVWVAFFFFQESHCYRSISTFTLDLPLWHLLSRRCACCTPPRCCSVALQPRFPRRTEPAPGASSPAQQYAPAHRPAQSSPCHPPASRSDARAQLHP